MTRRMGPLVMAFALLLTASVPAWARQDPAPLPRVIVIGTGGTIANTPNLPGGYRSADSLAAVIPEAAEYARVDAEQFTQLTSGAMGPEQWIGLARRINQLFSEQPDLAGVVVTHGTNRAEETAFFLHLTVRSENPVVVTAAQTPPDGMSADGPINLLSAVRVAASPHAKRMGAMMVMDERIMSAREASKIYNRVGGFEAREMGRLGIVAGQDVEFFYAPLRRHTYQSEFDLAGVTELPLVEATMSYGGSPGIGETTAQGVVIAATALSPAEIVFYQNLRRRGVIVAQTFPSGHNISYGGNAGADVPPVIGAQHLHPLKARILLALALTKTKDPREIQRIFSDY